MAILILKLMDGNTGINYYFEWSTLTGAPITYGMPLAEFCEYYELVYGEEGEKGLIERMKRVFKKGISTIQYDRTTLLKTNRAGENGAHISNEEILERYSKKNISGFSDFDV